MPTTEVILTEKVENLGAEADVVKVRRGYARNFLLPRGKAMEVTPAALKRLTGLQTKRAQREAAELNEAEELSRRINKLKVTMELETGEQGKAFGSITTNDIAERLQRQLGATVDRHRIQLEKPIKETGEMEIVIRLHPEVTTKLSLTVKAAGAEPEPAAEPAPAPEEKPAGGYKAKVKAKHNK